MNKTNGSRVRCKSLIAVTTFVRKAIRACGRLLAAALALGVSGLACAQAPVITITPANPGTGDVIFINITETPPNCPGLFATSSSATPPFPTDRIAFRGPSILDRAGTIYSCTASIRLYFPENGVLQPGVYPVTYENSISGFSTTIFITVSAVSGGVIGQAPTLSTWMMFLLIALIALIARRTWVNGRMGAVLGATALALAGGGGTDAWAQRPVAAERITDGQQIFAS